MTTLVFAHPALRELWGSIRDDELESAAVLLCVPVQLRSAGGWRLMVREMHVPTEANYEVRSPTRVQIKTEFCLRIEKRARLNKWSLVYVHTHPKQHTPEFSEIDDDTENGLSSYLQMRCPEVPHVSLLLGMHHLIAREIGSRIPVRVMELGHDVQVAYDATEPELLEERFDRQVRAFGPDGQARLSTLVVAIVGLGGTGSHVLQQLAHLGIQQFILVDPDSVEVTNLNRVVGATLADVGEPKTRYAERLIQGLGGKEPTVLRGDVTAEDVVRRVIEADIIFNCTDTQSSRHVLNQAAYQYMVPVIDMGVSVTVDANMHARFAGHVKMLSPGLPCLWCCNHLDPEALRREMMTAEQRQADPYVQGAATVVQPAVISLNGVVASAAVTMLLSAVAGVPAPTRYIHYDGNRARMNGLKVQRDHACAFCGDASTAGTGDAFPLPVRRRGEGSNH
ncbi:hypothetical protein GCM10028796_04730 [Ramlibacter monticola]|uniref:ThiF family adenylyltransferase n=1 Tax=Ramlibacter monticola TaxID=1926872 RepID=A0A936YZ53_9BURK|nr:ThiF family adenylyltransferase [Ramlibacter monticola]MBL0391244.1 ThiF family adenylyltransferase [Ramlibacter monticola]